MIWIASAAVALGTALGFWHLRATDPATRPPLYVRLAHAALGAAALAALLLTAPGSRNAAFLEMARYLFALALLTGGVVLLRRRRGGAVVLAAHAGIGISGYVLLLAWSQAG